MLIRMAALAALLVIAASCSRILGGDTPETPRLSLSVVPQAVAASDSFDVIVAVTNPADRPQTITSGCRGGLFLLSVEGSHSVRLEPTYACILQNRDVRIPADGLYFQYRLRLFPLDKPVVEAGEYEIRASAMARPLDDSHATAVLRVN